MEGVTYVEKRAAARLTPAEGRRFGLTLGVALGVLAGVSWWGARTILAGFLAIVAAILLVAAVAAPARLEAAHRAWMALARLLSRITTPVILALLYFGVITPTGLVVRAFGKSPLARRLNGDTYWVARATGPG